MPIIKTVGIVSKPGVEAAGRTIPKLIEWLNGRAIAVRCDEETGHYMGVAGIPRSAVAEGCDLLVVSAETARCSRPRAPSANARSRSSP